MKFIPPRLPTSLLHFLVLSLGLAACPAKEDYTPQIAVQPGAAARAMWIGSYRRDARDAGEKSAGARVHVMKAGDELGGPNAVGKPGDLLLENDEVAFVIDGLGSSAGFAESGGNVVDAADAHTRKDELGQMFTYFGTFPRQGVYSALTSGVARDGSAWVEAKGKELYEEKLAVVTKYTLHAADRALLMETTITNTGDAPIGGLALGDAIQWGGAEKLAPGKAVGFKGPSSGAYVGGIGRAVSYAITSTDGDIAAISGGSWTDTMQRRDVTLKAGESASYARVFVVGARADAASIVAELTHASGGELGAIEIGLVDDSGKAIDAPEGAKVVLSTPTGAEVLSIRAARASAHFGGEVPAGRYVLAYAGGGGRRGKDKTTVDVALGKTAQAHLGVTDGARLKLGCAEMLAGDDGKSNRVQSACKVTIEGLAGTLSPDFGPGHVAGPAKNQITSADGAIDVPLAPGKYRITLSRGPEYALAQWDASIAPGEEARPPNDEATVLKRVVDTRGYIATDFHQHTMMGADAAVGTTDRVIANAAEAVEIAVATEHNVVADLSPIVHALSLDAQLVALAGNELTTDASRHPWGHANVFPLAVDKTKARGGASIVRDRTAKELFAELRAIPGAHLLQINHPRTGISGYFDQYKFDRSTGVGTDPGYDPAFDALEVWNGRNAEARAPVIDDFFALLRTGHPVTATADTDTHGIVGQEAGYPRTYVRVKDDAHLASWNGSRSDDLVHGVRELRDVVLTNGPFIRVITEGAPVGGIARARGGAVTVKVHLECAPWVVVDHLRVQRANAPAAKTDDIPVTLQPTPTGSRAADATFVLRGTKDDAFIVIASGTTPLTPVLAGDPKEIAPFAMTGATWIDFDGDGKSLGR